MATQASGANRPTGAIVGAGAMGAKYVQVLREQPIELIAVAGRTTERAQHLAADLGVPAYAGYEALLSATKPDILFVCTPTETHLPVIELALEHGITAIYCEKPLAANLAEGRRIAQLVEQHGALLGIGFKMRYEAVFAKAQELVRAGEIGEVVATQFNYYQTVPDWAGWYLDSGCITELLSHPIDLSNWLMGRPPRHVSCAAYTTLGGKAEDRARITVNYGGHVEAQIAGGWIRDYPELPGRKHNICFQVVGERGYLLGMRPDLLHLRSSASQEFRPEPVDPFPLELGAFLRSVARGAAADVGIVDGLHAQQVIDAALESARTGQGVSCEDPVQRR